MTANERESFLKMQARILMLENNLEILKHFCIRFLATDILKNRFDEIVKEGMK